MSDNNFTCGICKKELKSLNGHYRNVHPDFYIRGKSSKAYVEKPREKPKDAPSPTKDELMKHHNLPQGALQNHLKKDPHEFRNAVKNTAYRVQSLMNTSPEFRTEDTVLVKTVVQTRAERDDAKIAARNKQLADMTTAAKEKARQKRRRYRALKYNEEDL